MIYNDDMTNNIRKIREAQGLSLTDLAEMAGVSVGYLSQLETGKRQLNENRLNQISKALGCKRSDLLQSMDAETSRTEENFSLLTSSNKDAVRALISALLDSQK